jgi:hypothetical protein
MAENGRAERGARQRLEPREGRRRVCMPPSVSLAQTLRDIFPRQRLAREERKLEASFAQACLTANSQPRDRAQQLQQDSASGTGLKSPATDGLAP